MQQMLPVTSGPSGPRRGSNGSSTGGGGARLSSRLDQFLLACCVAATCFLLWRLHSFSGLALVHGSRSGGISVISTTTVNSAGKGAKGAVMTKLVIDKNGKAKSTTVTRDDSGLSVTVLSDEDGVAEGGGAARLRYRQQQLQRVAERRRQQLERDQQLYPGLPRDFDAPVMLNCGSRDQTACGCRC